MSERVVMEIQQPIFKCDEDRRIFFQRIQALGGCEIIAAVEGSLKLAVAANAAGSAAHDISEICAYWSTSFRRLTP